MDYFKKERNYTMVDRYKGQRSAPFLAIPMRLLDNKEYLKWLGTPECRIWHVMVRYIIRAPMKNGLGKKIYENYYKNGKLAMYWRLDGIAKKAGMSSKSNISEHIQNMVKKGFIIKHKDKWNRRSISIYELGTHDNSVNRWETLHVQTKMIKGNANKMLKNLLIEQPDSV